MGLRDAAEQLDACKADAIRYEEQIRELQRRLDIAEQGWHAAEDRLARAGVDPDRQEHA